MTFEDTAPRTGARADLTTPRLLLETERLARNAERMRARCAALGVVLRPHLKTAKSLDVAKVADAGSFGPITVSTVKEAAYFAQGGYRDILYAVALAPSKLRQIDAIQTQTGARILLVVDSVAAAQALVAAACGASSVLHVLIEVDCGEHRSGVAPEAEALLPIARALAGSAVQLAGVMTHAGHSYAAADPDVIADIAEDERRAAVTAATLLREAGFPCPIVSMGSTPTVLFARHLAGITEVRCGIYMMWDLAQLSRGMCEQDDLAVSVLATVIGHNRAAGSLVIDAGALALSKDLGANTFLPDARYGYVCDPVSLERLGDLSVDVVHQEHGTVHVRDPLWFARLPIGALVRILPNHACITCAAYDQYDLMDGGRPVGIWERINGW